jgi:hypothetical protein
LDSPWLRGVNGEKTGFDLAPPLFLSVDQAREVRSVDARVSARLYTCIQTIVPEYLMCVTFFIRTFQAGNSAACEINVSTLGPPSRDWDYIRTRLRVYNREQKKGQVDTEYSATRRGTKTHLGGLLMAVGNGLQNSPAVFTSSTRKADLLSLEAFDWEALRHEQDQASKIAENSEFWPGVYTGLVSWREKYSLTFTTDFFGNTESRAVLRTLYDRICRSALNRLKELRFDISDYQDESGRFSINSESIEQLVVGERVFVDRKPKQADERKEAGGNAGEAQK